MPNIDTIATPYSLAQHFEAPDNYQGCFGWICGYSADAIFLNDAMERFTRQTVAQRAYIGGIHMALLLDPGNKYISLGDVPGVAHLPIKHTTKVPFNLLHSKVAILGFCKEDNGDDWQLRLLVSSGNWTRETLEESLDLVWRVDITSKELHKEECSQACTDVAVAWDFMTWLGSFFDTKILGSRTATGQMVVTQEMQKNFQTWVDSVQRSILKDVNSRFVDNREKSLLEQLLPNVSVVPVKRNYLAMGSGFFESPQHGATKHVPRVLQQIVKGLEERKLLTVSAAKKVFVNPHACQSVAPSQKAMEKAGYTIFPAAQPAFFGRNSQRTLHAKFLFSANCRSNSNKCNNAWVYLGSGNLTNPGFNQKAARNRGNLETGVIFQPENIYWELQKKEENKQIITHLLPIDTNGENETPLPLSCGGDMPERDVVFISPPVPFLVWDKKHDQEIGYLSDTITEEKPNFTLDKEGVTLSADLDGRFPWKGIRPRLVTIIWQVAGNKHSSQIPVLDEYGRLAATDLEELNLEEAWIQLANFPMPPDEDELSDVNPFIGATLDDESREDSSGSSSYMIRQVMELIENIAAKQTMLHNRDWASWCVRLERCLTQAAKSTIVKEFKRLGLNPLSPLWAKPFRPVFAETRHTPEGQQYEIVLSKIEEAWSVSSLASIGDK